MKVMMMRRRRRRSQSLETSRAEALHDLDRSSIGNLGLSGSPATNSVAMAIGGALSLSSP
jgi:hypothetical protein